MSRKNRARREAQGRGQIELFPTVIRALAKAYEGFDWLLNELRFKGDIKALYVPVRKMTLEHLKFLHEKMSLQSPQPRSTMAQIQSHISIIESPQGKVIGQLIILESALTAYIKKNIIQGWLFVKPENGERLQPLLVSRIVYNPPQRGRDYNIPAHVDLRGSWWSKGKIVNRTFTWYHSDLGEKTVDELLLEKELIKETRQMVDEFLKDEEQFLKWRKLMGHQFVATGTIASEDPNSWWGDEEAEEITQAKVVIDDRCDSITAHVASELFHDLENQEEDGNQDELEHQAAEAGYTRLPTVHYIWVFNLESHESGYMHISTMKPYVYHPELQSKLILPLKHADLIETLAFERDFLMDDIIKGKSGGTTIICQGPAGTGKTLTAEIYAEVIKKPLYRVHSGQLGITADTVEESLKAALQRATRWKCILLIDECDVFLKQRGDSLEQNAIVAVFLRIIEYYDGLMFLTTNRQDDIDDAILSRCLAKIQYQKPTKAEREKLWATLSEVYKVNLTKKQCAELAERYDDCSGRDIKGLLRLAIKYARRKKHPMGLDDIYRLAPFRGM